MLRRTFLHSAAVATAATALARSTLVGATAPAPKIAVGLDHFAVREMGWINPNPVSPE